MFEIFLLSMLMGGLATMVEKEGGIEWVLQKIKKVIKNQTTGELGIATMVSLTDMATANNTVSILINGSVAKEIDARSIESTQKERLRFWIFSPVCGRDFFHTVRRFCLPVH